MGNKYKTMKNIYIDLLKSTSNNEITLLRNINKIIKTNKNGKFNYFYIPNFQINEIKNFISKLEVDSLYTIIPMISIYGKDEEPYLILSKQILVTNYSNHLTISNFISNQLEIALNDFNFKLDRKYHFLIFKFKKINVLF